MIDIWQEIYSTIKRNKLRTFLTGFAVAWGIFMLIVLLGAGNGLIHAFEQSASERAMNSIKIFPGRHRRAGHCSPGPQGQGRFPPPPRQRPEGRCPPCLI